ncbi:MAG: 4Fe-4S binding protein [Candidatus Jordarchaeum sp.]|uniref:4Fe-4S binding protein n=1 Tax=Candidatus Jordarchaeum sp. TaxID=2823881 RepID=UPI004049C239
MLKKHLKLTLDRNKCVGCGICMAICPMEAIERGPVGASRKGLTKAPTVLIDHKKCSFCGICEIFCPFGCIELTIDGEHKLIIQENKALPKIEKIEVDCVETGNKAYKFFEGEIIIKPENCPGGCSTCIQICPVGALSIPKKQSWEKSAKIEVDKEKCILCGACVNSCPAKDVIEIKREKINFSGEHTEIWQEIIDKLRKPQKI